LVGLSRFPYASFAALKHTYDALFVLCVPCRRYIRLAIGPIRERDSRRTTFSCSVCGGVGQVVIDDPGNDGYVLDPREKPERHPVAYARLTGRTCVAREPPRWLIDPPKRGP
jgi:hypothetical protein